MLNNLYCRHPHFFNLLVVLVLIETTRTLDGLAWYPPAPGKARIVLLQHLFEFLSLLLFVLLRIAWQIHDDSGAAIHSGMAAGGSTEPGA